MKNALVLLGIPLFVVAIDAASYRAANRSNGTLISSGEEREYLLHVPRSYDRTRPAPLVISMHGGAMWPTHQRDTSRWNRLADEHGFIVVYPAGTLLRGNDTSGRHRYWNVNRGAGLMKDVRFISDLIDRLQADYDIDATRIYADGLSNGGGMAFVLSCKLSDRIAAVGMVASAQSLPWSWCTDARPMPVIVIHGTADPTVPYKGGGTWAAHNVGFPSIPTWTANWARRNQCSPDPLESTVAEDVTRAEYRDCAGNASVVLYTVRDGGHTWPGGKPMPEWMVGRTSNSIDASSEMWKFYRDHRLVRRLTR